MRLIRYLLDKLIDFITERYVISGKKKTDIDLSDLLTKSDDDALLADEFKSFSSTADYNRELLNVFQFHRKDIVLDISHKDGHFRV